MIDAMSIRSAEVLLPRTLAVLGGTPAFDQPIYVTQPPVPDTSQYQRRVADVIRSRCFTNNGPMVREFEEKLRSRLGVGFCAATANGTLALQIALRALDIEGEVITTPFTFPATVHAIQWNGLTPVFCDIDPATYNLDVSRAAELVGNRTAALLPVHVFGNPCDVAGIDALATRSGLKVIYDAAHAFGVLHRDRSIVTWGDLSILSFHATKLFHCGEGGAIVGADAALFERSRLLRNFGIVSENEVSGVGLNGKLSELHAALGLGVLDVVGAEIDARGRVAARYRERLVGIEGFSFQQIAPDTVQNHSYFTIEIDADAFGLSRDEVHKSLLAENIRARRYFSPLCSENECYRDIHSARPELLPHASRLALSNLCLPIYGGLDRKDVDRIVECLHAIKSAAGRIRDRLRVTRKS